MNKIIRSIQTNHRLNDIRIIIYNLLNFHKKGDYKDIFIFTSARSGSTLLEKIVASQPGFAYIDEPLNWKRFCTKRTPIKPDYQYICSDPNRREAFKRYFDDILSNKMTIHFPLAFWRPFFTVCPNRYVFKCINGKDLINWFEENFNIHVVYLLRHPIATALSRINWNWSDINRRFSFMLNDRFFLELTPSELVEYARRKLSNGSEIERFVTGWCIENYIPLIHLDKTRWVIVSYEELLVNSRGVLSTLHNKLDLRNLDLMLSQITMPSGSTSAYQDTEKLMRASNKDTNKYLIERWRRKITEEEEKKVFEILHNFGINVYVKGTSMPDLNYAVQIDQNSCSKMAPLKIAYKA